jgi:uncharacterized protein (DUF2267 family)
MESHVSTIERNINTTNVWLNEISDELNQIDKEEAWTRLGAVLQTVRDRIPVDEAADFAAQLPELIRGVYFQSWNPSDTPKTWRHREEYLGAFNEKLGPHDPIDAEETIRAVLKVAARHMDNAALKKVKDTHPKEVWDLWPV